MHLTSLPIDEDRKGWGEWDRQALNYGYAGKQRMKTSLECSAKVPATKSL